MAQVFIGWAPTHFDSLHEIRSGPWKIICFDLKTLWMNKRNYMFSAEMDYVIFIWSSNLELACLCAAAVLTCSHGPWTFTCHMSNDIWSCDSWCAVMRCGYHVIKMSLANGLEVHIYKASFVSALVSAAHGLRCAQASASNLDTSSAVNCRSPQQAWGSANWTVVFVGPPWWTCECSQDFCWISGRQERTAGHWTARQPESNFEGSSGKNMSHACLH